MQHFPTILSVYRTFAEADSVLRPGGTIAIFNYGNLSSEIPEVHVCIEKVKNPIFNVR